MLDYSALFNEVMDIIYIANECQESARVMAYQHFSMDQQALEYADALLQSFGI